MNRALSMSVLCVLAQTGVCGALPANAAQPASQPEFAKVDQSAGKPRLFVLSDIGNEPDDQMSFVRLLLYTNEIDLEGVVATTSTFQRNATHAETFRQIIADFGKVRNNLLLHAKGWPTQVDLEARVAAGQPGYGMTATGEGKTSDGARALIAAVDAADARPLWIAAWGGTNTLAQALIDVRQSRSAAQVEAFVAKMRIYAISDQDDAGPWIRRNFPSLFYVVRPSPPDASEFSAATWTGISGDRYYLNGDGADFTTVTNEWLDMHIRSVKPLGDHYPRYEYIMEGDTPSFLGLIGNGLESYRNPSWGGWGGRYVYRQPYGESHPIWTQGGDMFFRVDSRDTVKGTDGRARTSDQASIWRWREAYQNDFAARMQWTTKPFGQANHAPRLTLNGNTGTKPLFIDVKVGQTVTLDAGKSVDPDGNAISYRWFVYDEAGFSQGQDMAAVTIEGSDQSRASVTASSACRPLWAAVPRKAACEGTAHVILEARDNGTPSLVSYRRVIFSVHPQ